MEKIRKSNHIWISLTFFLPRVDFVCISRSVCVRMYLPCTDPKLNTQGGASRGVFWTASYKLACLSKPIFTVIQPCFCTEYHAMLVASYMYCIDIYVGGRVYNIAYTQYMYMCINICMHVYMRQRVLTYTYVLLSCLFAFSLIKTTCPRTLIAQYLYVLYVQLYLRLADFP